MSLRLRLKWPTGGGTWWEGVLLIEDDGQVATEEARDTGDPAPMAHWDMLANRASRHPATRHDTCGCMAAPEVRWLGMRWRGTPWPMRHAKRLVHLDEPGDWRGCGCLVKAKAATLAARDVLNAARWAARRAMEA